MTTKKIELSENAQKVAQARYFQNGEDDSTFLMK